MIRYTKKIRDILNFIDKYGFITTRICANLFFKDNKYKIDLARRVLTRLVNNKDIIASKDVYGKELIYQFKKNTVSDHKYALLNLYSEINCLVNSIEYFKLEESWKMSSKRSDAHIIVTTNINNEVQFKSFLIEYDKFHKTNPNDKYNEIYNSNEVQEWYKTNYDIDDYFPDVIIINYNGKTEQSTNENFNIVGLDYNFTDLTQKILLG